jgi:uncharacterized protein
MRKALQGALYIAICYGIVLIIGYSLPKYKWAMNPFMLLLLLDGYLWTSIAPVIRKYGIILRIFLWFFYWYAFLLIIFCLVYGAFVAFLDWNIGFRTDILNIIFMTYVAKLIPIGFLGVKDIVNVIRRSLPSNGPIIRFRPDHAGWFMKTGWIAGSCMFLALLSGMLIWIYDFRVKEETVEIQGLPPAFNGMTIAQISDIHLGSWTSRSSLEKAINMVNDLKPDVIFMTGDMVNYATSESNGFVNILAKLKARDGIFVIMGNHDYGQYMRFKDPKEIDENIDALCLLYKNLGWKLLRNEQFVMIRGTDTIAILGVENWGMANRFPKLADIIKAEKGTENIATKLLLSHDPSYWEHIIIRHHPEIDMTFSGHTHGGQIGIETSRVRFSTLSLKDTYWAGMYEKKSSDGSLQRLYVNRGLGTIGYAGRIGILPEITLFTLKTAR